MPVERLTELRTRGSAPVAVVAPGSLLDVGLVLTHACNLACAYCYTGEKKRVRMSEQLAIRAVELAIAQARATCSTSRRARAASQTVSRS